MSGPLGAIMAFLKDDDEEPMKVNLQGMYYMNVKVMAFWDVTPYSLGHGN
jgi:hypothetical protein